MDAISYVINTITKRIPRKVLEIAFDDTNNSFFSTQQGESLESRIESKYLREIFIPDLNLAYGTRSRIPVAKAEVTHRDANSIALHFSDEALEGLSIVSVYNVLQNYAGGPQRTTGTMESVNRLAGAGSRTLPNIANPQTRIVGNNTVLITDKGMVDVDWYIDVMLSNDPNLNNIDARIYPVLAKTALEGCKGYIHNEIIVNLNGSALMGGQELGVVSEIVEGYSDAYELYDELKEEELMGALVNADPLLQESIIKAQFLPLL